MNGFQLDELRIDPLTGDASGPGGCEKLDPKVMQVLVYMAEHAGQVVSREDLLAHLWPDAVVTDDALTRCFYELRKQLSHAGGDERYRALLETLPKRGYRLNGKVTPVEPKRRTLTLTLGLAAAVLVAALVALFLARSTEEPKVSPPVATPNSIAVLPFLDMSAEKDQAFFSDGITEEILNRLSQSENLRVIARTSSFSFRDETLDVPQIGEKLNVAYVLEGSVRKSGDRLRITAQLIDVSTNSHVWSETYDRGLDDLFAVQDEIALSVATALQVTLAGGNDRGQTQANIDAYERFLQGQFFYNRRAPGDIERAVKYYQEAVRIDPQYARAYAALAGAYSLLATDGDNAGKLRESQGEAAQKAVELDPKLAVAHARLSQYYFNTAQNEKGDEHMRTARALDPNEPLVLGFSSGEAILRGDLDEAVSLWRRVVAQDPLSPTHRGNLAGMLLANGQYEEALAETLKVLELHPEAGPKEEIELVRVFVLLERYDEAQSALMQIPEGKYRDYGQALLDRAPGRRAGADAALERLVKDPGDLKGRVHLADAYVHRGLHDEALTLLQETLNELERDKASRPYLPRYFRNDLRLSPFLKPLHSDPRWSALTARPD